MTRTDVLRMVKRRAQGAGLPSSTISYESHMCIIKKGGKIFIVDVTKRISELKRTNNNVIELPVKRGIPDI
jgi:hypothetical protein